MKTSPLQLRFLLPCLVVSLLALGQSRPLSDGKTFAGWEGDTNRTWRIVDGAFVGGSLENNIPQNEFLATHQSFTNFVLKLKFKLVGTEGFVNAGVQIRSERTEDPPNEMRGYQADIGEGWWGALYDESRRNTVLVKPDPADVKKALRPGDWNEYTIRCEDRRIRTWINGVPMIDYTEPDQTIPQHGLIGLQIHGGAKAEVSYKEITLERLPSP
ncbi:MAG: DUF1080 domain-containing protein [Verrucomicrobia bacterium]|nr:DUF1080 domain-containing protein [Verrucomicrobiota bacterium]